MNPSVVPSVSGVRAAVHHLRNQGNTVGLVPTMGALHAGHARLMAIARSECDFVVTSVFVNPLQFGPAEDYARYPRPLSADVDVCAREGVDLVFAPSVQDMYANPQLAFAEVPRLSEHLCGEFRPGHFRGVATVVLKLFNIVQPERAYFGEKDYQQLCVIRRMVEDFNLPVHIVGVPTVRESDGLALSSRNAYLEPAQRAAATLLFRALEAARMMIEDGEINPSKVKEDALSILAADPQIRPQYFEIVDPSEVQPVPEICGPVRIAGAIWMGKTRLIDNVPATPPQQL